MQGQRKYVEGTCVITLDTDMAWLPNIGEQGQHVHQYPYVNTPLDNIHQLSSSGNHLCMTLTSLVDTTDSTPPIVNCTGVIFIHAVGKEAKVKVMAVPIGALLFRCDPKRRDVLLQHGKLDCTWFDPKDTNRFCGVTPVYFPIDIQAELMKVILVHNAERIQLRELRTALHQCLHRQSTDDIPSYVSVMSSTTFPMNYHQWIGHLRELTTIYLEHRCHHDIARIDERSGKRTLSTIEYLALLFKVEFFYNKQTGLSKHQMCDAVNRIQLPYTVSERDVISSNIDTSMVGVEAYINRLTTISLDHENHQLIYPKCKIDIRDPAIVNALMSLDGDRLRLMETELEYVRMKTLFYTNLQVMSPVFDTYTAARQALYHSTIAVNFKLAELMEAAGCSAPCTMFAPTDEVQSWCDKEISRVAEILALDAFLQGIFKNGKPVLVQKDVFKVYGYTDRLDTRVLSETEYLADISDNNKESVVSSYTISRVSTLTMCDWVTDPIAPCIATSETRSELRNEGYNYPHLNPHLTPTGKALTYAGMGGYPVLSDWRDQKTTVPKPSSFIRIMKTTTEQQSGAPLDEILQNVLTQANGKCHELIHSELHITTLVIDIDIKSGLSYTQADAAVVAKDAVTLFSDLAAVVFPTACKLTHYVFWSRSEQSTNKLGLHHHIRLADGYAITHMVAGEIVKILADLRFLYPKTVGVFCGKDNDNVYDTNIYSLNEAGFSSHSLRLPGQYKPDGTHQLSCIFRTDNMPVAHPIPWRVCYAHSPHEQSSGGILISKLVGIRHINNRDYLDRTQSDLLNSFIRVRHTHTIKGLMHAFNQLTYMFNIDDYDTPSDRDVTTLLNIVGKLWVDVGVKKMTTALGTARGDNQTQYTLHDITQAMRSTKIVAVKDELRVVGQNGTSFPICPVRVHNTPHANGVEIGISMKPGGAVLAFRIVTVFKPSCRGQFIFSVDLTPAYLSSYLHTWFNEHLRFLFKRHNNVQQWTATLRYMKSGDQNVELIVYKKREPDELPLSEDVEKLYMVLVDDKLIVFKTTTNVFSMISFDDSTMLIFKTCGAKLFFGGLSNTQFRPHISQVLLDRLCTALRDDGYDI